MSKYLSLAVFAGLTAAASLLGANFMPDAWYVALNKPSWTPPNWLFGPVWTVLYVMIALAGWYAWRARGMSVAVVLWVIQMSLNGLWSFLMFGQKDITLALIDIVVLLAVILAFIAATIRSVPKSAMLFVPYAAWVAFATALNFAIWRLNG